ncbi:MAG: glycosyltransferase family 4 protein [Cyanobacteriota bacterium]
MKILFINNYFNNEGGAESLVNRTGQLLEQYGHEVYYFATNKLPYYIDNYQYSTFFPEYTNYKDLSKFKKAFYSLRSIYNIESKNKLIDFIKEINPDIAHVSSVSYFLTPSVINALYLMRIPTVMTLHNPYLVCPSVRLMFKNERYCTEKLCVSGNPLNCLRYNCFENNIAKSCISTLEFLFRKTFKLLDHISYFICPSNALADLLISSGINTNRIITINNFVSESYLNTIHEFSKGNYFLYTGRMSPEKGLTNLINTYSNLNLPVKLHITGTGSQEKELKELVNRLNTDKIIFTGFKKNTDLVNEYNNCISTILPTIGFETFGLSIVEGFASGKPAIGSNIGGIPEVIDNNVNGFLFDPDDLISLANYIKELYHNTDKAIEMGKNGRNKVKQFYNQELYLSKLLHTYKCVLDHKDIGII